jgi:hypothetical protein
MKRLRYSIFLLIALLFSAAARLLTACSDSYEEDPVADWAATLNLSLQTGSLTTRGDTDEPDPESYIDTLNLFGYADTTAQPVYTRKVTIGSDQAKTLKLSVSSTQLEALFPDGATTCTFYAVANLSDTIAEMESLTLSELKAIALHTDFTQFDGAPDLMYMDGQCTVTMDTKKMTLTGALELERAVTKIQLKVVVEESIKGADGEIYEPLTAYVKTSLRGWATRGLLHGPVNDNKGRTLQGDSTSYSRFKTQEATFYSYPTTWTSNFTDSEPTLLLVLPWRKQGEQTYKTYYYQVPVNYTGSSLKRNTLYQITLNVGMLGSIVEETPLEVNPESPTMDYEILPWGSTGNHTVSAQLIKSHYLVAEDTEFTLTNKSDLSFTYTSCDTLESVNLTSISYESDNDSGTSTKLYIYRSTGSYTTDETTVRNTFTTKPENLARPTDTPDRLSTTGEFLGTGTISFKAAIDDIAGKICRPITYTLELLGQADHGNTSITVTITQTPAKYIEWSEGGNVFVNGYYSWIKDGSNLNGATSFTYSGNTYYYSYSFLVNENYSAVTNNSSYNGQCYSSSIDASSAPGYSNTSASSVTDYISTGYEYLRRKFNDDVNYTNMVKVHVSAFTTSDNMYTVIHRTAKTDDGTDASRTYIIGDPRVKGTFTKASTHSTTYTCSGNELYDYYVEGVKSGNYYYRRTHSWDNAGEIMIGGTKAGYQDVIAPSYMIQSDYGMPLRTCFYEVAQRRCATYQEQGYPAGRWRLPTVAELAYVMNLQINGLISKMFMVGTRCYWATDGSAVWINSDGAAITHGENYATTWTSSTMSAAVRCVYDTWYWGDNPVTPVNVYHPQPTN